MSKRILIQAGHYNVKNNCYLPFTTQTGAPQEMDRNYKIAIALIAKLNKNGFNAQFTDANINCPSNESQANQDWDLFLALHSDANYSGDEGGGFIDYPDPSVDSSNVESKRIKEAIEGIYFQETGIRNVPTRSNANTKFYYAWQVMTAKTPCVIVEMGESIDPHDSVLLNNTELIANALLKGIMKAFGVTTPDTTTPPPVVVVPPVVDCKPALQALQNQFDDYKKEYKYKESDISAAISKGYLNGKLEMKSEIISLINAY